MIEKKNDNNRGKLIDIYPIDEINDHPIDNPMDRIFRNRQSMVVIDWIGLASLTSRLLLYVL